MSWEHLVGFVAGVVIATVTAPVGVSGAVFLLPVQLDVLGVPSPQVTPTNLLYNVIATPGALLRYRRQGQFGGGLTRLLLLGTVPGVIAGAAIRVHLVPGDRAFRIIAASVLLPLGVYVLRSGRRGPAAAGGALPRAGVVIGLSLAVGVVGGIYGIGGGSILGPALVGMGMSVVVVAPAALASTFVTSLAGACTYAALAVGEPGAISPDWDLGLACGLGGLLGGYVGARLQPRLPERALRVLLGSLAIGLAVAYLWRAAAG